MEYLILILLWSAWCACHSGMISVTVTAYMERRLGDRFRYYRLFFNVVALLTLIPVYLYSIGLKGNLLFQWDGLLTFVRWVLLVVAGVLFISGGRKYDMRQLLGIRQIRSGKLSGGLSETGDIDTSGILGITRHPWYLGAIILIWAYNRNIYLSTLMVNVILTAYLVIGTVLEERKLILAFGDSYRIYMQRVSMLLPFKWVRYKLFSSHPIR